MLKSATLFGLSRTALIRMLVVAVGLCAAMLPLRHVYAATDCAAATDVPQVECQTLVSMYNENNGVGWKNNTNWLDDNTVCDWYGVTCTDGHVSALDLSNNGLTGVVSLAGIGKVLKVDLSGNDVVRQQTTDYLLLGLAAVVAVMGALLLSIVARYRGAVRDIARLEAAS